MNTTVQILCVWALFHTAACLSCPDQPSSGREWIHKSTSDRPVLTDRMDTQQQYIGQACSYKQNGYTATVQRTRLFLQTEWIHNKSTADRPVLINRMDAQQQYSGQACSYKQNGCTTTVQRTGLFLQTE